MCACVFTPKCIKIKLLGTIDKDKVLKQVGKWHIKYRGTKVRKTGLHTSAQKVHKPENKEMMF